MSVFGFAWYRGWDSRNLLQQFHAVFGGNTGDTRACHDHMKETFRVTSQLGSVKLCFVIMINFIPSVCQWYFTILSGWFPLYPTALTDTHSTSVLPFWLLFCHFVLLMFLSSTCILHLVGMYIFYAVFQFLWRTLVNVVMNLRVPWSAGNFLTSFKPVSSSRRTLHHGLSKYSVPVPNFAISCLYACQILLCMIWWLFICYICFQYLKMFSDILDAYYSHGFLVSGMQYITI